MSKRNTQEAKRAARERLRIEREKQAKKEKMRRTLAIGGGIVAVLALAGGIGYAVTNLTGGGGEGHWETAAKVAEEGPGGSADGVTYKAPANASGKGGTEIVIGDKSAEHTLAIYEDMRCPVCAAFEQNVGETVKKGLEDGDYKVSYTFGTFIDENPTFGGTGSKNALSALGAALDESPEAFMAYKEELFSKEGHPPENKDEFGDDAYLIDVAQKVDALKGDKKFEKAVNNGTYDAWAMNISKKFDDAGIQGTPTLKLDGEKLTVDGQSPPMTPEQFTTLIEEKLGGGSGDGEKKKEEQKQ